MGLIAFIVILAVFGLIVADHAAALDLSFLVQNPHGIKARLKGMLQQIFGGLRGVQQLLLRCLPAAGGPVVCHDR